MSTHEQEFRLAQQELRSTQQELAESRRHAENQTSELDKANAQIIELHSELAAKYESTVPIVTQIKSILQNSSDMESEEQTKQLAKCHQMMIEQQNEYAEKVHDLQQRYNITNAHLQSKNSELKTQLEDKTKECEQAVTKLDEKERVILEYRNCETDLRSEVQTVRAQKEHLEKNFETVSAALNKARNERKEAQDRLKKYKYFVDQVSRNWNTQVKNIDPGSPVLTFVDHGNNSTLEILPGSPG
ncbi:hypothetical protein Ddc_10726 [Ditylenchus destructor]|nr:hypothetical protein Ddc_10726 [Ditylenchus destructor]